MPSALALMPAHSSPRIKYRAPSDGTVHSSAASRVLTARTGRL